MPLPLVTLSPLPTALITAAVLGVACALLSVIVVLRRWAFIGEGIAHAGFGGAGTAWLLALAFPAAATWLNHSATIHAFAVFFALLVAVAIAWVTRRRHVQVDTAIGIFLVASLAWGFVALDIYRSRSAGSFPPDWDQYVIGRLSTLSTAHLIGAVVACLGVCVTLALLWKEIMAYCFDPELAEIAGVRVGFIHLVLLLLMTLTILVGTRLTGSLLIVALLVLPGATAMQLSRNMNRILLVSSFTGVAGALAGPLIHHRYRFIPEGPAIVLTLVILFALAFAIARLRPRGSDD